MSSFYPDLEDDQGIVHIQSIDGPKNTVRRKTKEQDFATSAAKRLVIGQTKRARTPRGSQTSLR